MLSINSRAILGSTGSDNWKSAGSFTHYSKTNVVILVVGIVVVAIGRAAVLWIVVPAAAPHHF